MNDAPHQPTRGCLNVALFDGVVIAVSCGIWYFFVGPMGVLIGIAQYFVVRFALFFSEVFAPRQNK